MADDISAAGVDVRTLELAYEDGVHERDRLRDARRSVTSQLGPLPAASAIVVGLFGALSDDIHGMTTVIIYGVALALFVAIAAVSTRAITYEPYRVQRENAEKAVGWTHDETLLPSEWLVGMMTVERAVKKKLESAFDRERKWLLIVQWMIVVQILLLGVIVLIGRWGEQSSL
jgi:hypothetical protein